MSQYQDQSVRLASEMTPREWYAEHGCTHAHCPLGCEHPQPFIGVTGELLCGRCAFKDQVTTVMVPCTVETCET